MAGTKAGETWQSQKDPTRRRITRRRSRTANGYAFRLPLSAGVMCTVHVFNEINNPEFRALKADIVAYPRLCGYYIIELVSIRDFRVSGAEQEEILEKVIDHFDDDPVEPDPDFVPDHDWSDYETNIDRARIHTIKSLVGGPEIGHIVQTMDESMACELFDRFVEVCGPNPRFYIGLGIGNREFVCLYGVLIVADDLAGILWVVESD